MRLFVLLLGGVLAVSWYIGRRRGVQIDDVPVRAPWLIFVALVMQVPLWWALGGSSLQSAFFVLSYGLLFLFCYLNRHLWSMYIIAFGFLLNFAVIAANGGFMPIAPETLVRLRPDTTVADWPAGMLRAGSKDIVLPREQTRLWFLSDTLVIPPPFLLPTAFSLGDVFIFLGFAALCWQLFVAPPSLRPGRSSSKAEVHHALH